jgi:response regulator RpfG family c-di-GMP phosphodiesterase
MLKMEGYDVLTASSGLEALPLLKEHRVHVLISDMQMPQMNGAQLLQEARLQSPATIRLLLTGAADLNSAIDAVNQGEIYRYLTKPWNDAELLGIIRQAIEQYEQAAAREARLRHSFLTAIKAYSGLMDLRRPDLLAHSRRVANLSRRIAKRMGLPESQIQEIYIAALLHDVGKIGLLDRILETKFIELPLADAKQYKLHPEMGQKCLRIVDELDQVGLIVRAHHEYFDGSGFPDGLKGDQIPLGARILAIVEAFEELIEGQYAKSPSTPESAVKVIASNRGKLFDPVVTDHFLEMLNKVLHQLQ